MRERAVSFGSHGGLVGVLTETDAPASASRPAVLLFNVGLNHHVGPHRLNVEIARHVASRGFAALRFDLAGLGDSEPRKDSRSDEERACVDLREAMDFLQQRGFHSFVVVALCSGVDPAHAVAATDPRMKGAVFIDGYAYPTLGFFMHEAADRVRRLFGSVNYRRWFRHRILPLLGRRGALDTSGLGIFDRSFPPLTQFTTELNMMLGRGTEILFIYTRQAYDFNHRAQFEKMIGVDSLPSGIEVEHQLGADHTFTPVQERARVVCRLGDWLAKHFADDAGVRDPLHGQLPTASLTNGSSEVHITTGAAAPT